MSSKNNPFKKKRVFRPLFLLYRSPASRLYLHRLLVYAFAGACVLFPHLRCQPAFLLQRSCVFSVVPRQVYTLLSPAPFAFACVFHTMPNMPLFPSFIPAHSKFLTKKAPPFRGVFFCLFFGQPFRARHFHQVINQHCRQHIDDKRKRRIGQHAHPRHIANQRLLDRKCR